eukprot:6126210-Amphidinium_carterae.1
MKLDPERLESRNFALKSEQVTATCGKEALQCCKLMVLSARQIELLVMQLGVSERPAAEYKCMVAATR